jgi:uncharacterized protein (TIGR02246 family)
MMKSRITLAVGAVAAVLVVGCSKPPQFTAEDEAAVHALFDGTVKSINAGNIDAWAAEFTDDAIFQPPNGKAVSGRAAIAAWGKALPAMEHFGFPNVKVMGEGNVAYGTSAYNIKMTGVPADTGKQLVVAKKGADGKWMVVAAAFNSDIPLPPPPAAKPSPKPAGKAATKAPAKGKAPAKTPPPKTVKKGGRPSTAGT